MQYLILSIGLLIGLWLLAVGFANADPGRLARLLKIAGAAVGAAVLILLVLSGRLGLLIWAVPFLVPALIRWRSGRRRARVTTGPSPGRISDVETDGLRAWLDHDRGDMDGEVRRGGFAGRRLSELGLDDLRRLRLDMQAGDPASVPLIEAYLDRVHPGWRTGADQDEAAASGAGSGDGATAGTGGMSVAEAYEILGLAPGATEEAIREAHRRLMIRNHPDQGGSTYLAAKINQAKDILLARTRATG